MIPRDPALDATLALLREGYAFVWNRCRRLGADAFRTRVLGRPLVCLHGPEAAALFYDAARMRRAGAVPRPVATSLFGEGALHTLDGEVHRRRKEAFLRLLSPASLGRLAQVSARCWRDGVRAWEGAGRVVLLEEVPRVLARAACAWAGVPLPARDAARRARDLASMAGASGGAGPRWWRGQLARRRSEQWIIRLVKAVRAGEIAAREDRALGLLARLPGSGGALLPARTAAVEILNVLRPAVAISRLVAFAALALAEHPEERALLAVEGAGGERADRFAQEVRRYYPFAPYLGARARVPVAWHGETIAPGTRVLLDVWGASRDPRIWGDPEVFRPGRFRGRAIGAYDFIPQGGGPRTGHRCPGEWVTRLQLALALHVLARCTTWALEPGQDARFDLGRMPARPRSGVVLREVRATAALDAPMPAAPSPAVAREAAEGAGELGGPAAGRVAPPGPGADVHL